MRNHRQEETVVYKGGAQRSKKPRYSLVPRSAFDAMAARFELGQEKHGERAWSAISANRETALTQDWVRAAMEHAINHALVAIQKIDGLIEDDGDDDGGALLFAGAVLVEYNRLKRERSE